MKRYVMLGVVLVLSFGLWNRPVLAGDIEAILDSADGSSGFVVKDSVPSEVFRADSNGNVTLDGTVDGYDISVKGSNWDIAYGWGNHASAGYQAGDADLTDLADGSLTGSKVGTGIAAGNISAGTVATARLGTGTASSSTYLRGDQTWTATSGVPSGVICMWSGTLATIPTGWSLCDGGGSPARPDLRDRFIYGTPAAEDPGATGGATTHSHTYTCVPAHTHAVDPPSTSTSTAGAHTHDFPNRGNTYGPYAGYLPSRTTYPTLTQTASAGAHAHTVDIASFTSGSTGSASCTTATASSLPPYYKLAFIMKD